VIRIRRLPAQTLFGREYPEREAYPSDEQWGSLAWSYGAGHKSEAFERFNGLVAKHGNSYPGEDKES
jgi:hypothetical protein